MRAWARVGSNSAAATTWGIDAATGAVTIKRAGAMLADKRNGVAVGLQMRRARARVVNNGIAGVDTGARLTAPARIPGRHGFDCHWIPSGPCGRVARYRAAPSAGVNPVK